MGIKRRKEAVKWTEALMQRCLQQFRTTPRYVIQNLFVFGWESDILFLSKTGFWTELEIKISRADFKADLIHKSGKHAALSDKGNHIKPNQFFYAVPEGLVMPDEVPDYAGLVVVDHDLHCPRTVKPAPWLHRHKIDPNSLDLADKFYYNMINAKKEALIAKRTAEELTDSYRQGRDEGHRLTLDAALEIMAERCPHREMADMGRIHCRELNQTKFGICRRGLCTYLEKVEEQILTRFKK